MIRVNSYYFLLMSALLCTSCSSENDDYGQLEPIYFIKNNTSGLILSMDTFYRQMTNPKDSILLIKYLKKRFGTMTEKEVNIDPIVFIAHHSKGGKQIIPFERSFNYNRINFTLLNGRQEIVFETYFKDASEDQSGVQLISSKYGLLFSYSKSWNNYYVYSGSSNDIEDQTIYYIIQLYLERKGTYYEVLRCQ